MNKKTKKGIILKKASGDSEQFDVSSKSVRI
jgi:hypothetical protein